MLCTAAGPAWARGELEPPQATNPNPNPNPDPDPNPNPNPNQGAKRTVSGFAAAVYTPEQQERLAGVRLWVGVQP